MFGLPINPSVNASEAATDDEANWHVLSIWQELLRDDKSDGDKMLVRVIIFEITSARLLTLVVEALKNVVKYVYVVYSVLYTNSTSESVLREEDNSLISGAALLGLFLSLDESREGTDGFLGLKSGFNVILGRVFFTS